MTTTVKVTTEMTFDDLMNKAWGGAVQTLSNVEKAGKEDELMSLLADWSEVAGQVTMTGINDCLWFDDGYIYDCLGMAESEEEA